jgi:hypothetical protein
VPEEKMEALRKELIAFGKETTACQKVTEAYLEKAKAKPQNSKAGLEEMGGHGFGGKSRSNGGRSGNEGTSY